MKSSETTSFTREDIAERAKRLDSTDISFLVSMLAVKDDRTRYNALLLLQANSRLSSLTYGHWDEFEKKLESPNTYQRTMGLRLISENVKWDKEGRFGKTIHKYLGLCSDEKFVAARVAIQGLVNVVESTDKYDNIIEKELNHLPLGQYKSHQQRLLKRDVSSVLEAIKNKEKSNA